MSYGGGGLKTVKINDPTKKPVRLWLNTNPTPPPQKIA